MVWTPLIETLEHELINDIVPKAKHIIRFRSAHHFKCCAAYLKKNKSSPMLKKSYTLLPMIHSIACPLKTPINLLDFPMIHSIERDSKIQLNKNKSRAISAPTLINSKLKHPVPWGIKHIKARRLWGQSLGSGVHIGVIDTGADFGHPDLRRCLEPGVNFIKPGTLPIDDNGHGTHVVGTIAANRPEGLTGIAPRAIIHPVKSFDHQGSAYISDIILGIEWCIQNKMDIINMSFGMKQRNRSLYDAVLYAKKAGIIVVASSGNDGKASGIDYPARFHHSIGVGACDQKNRITAFSNRGKFLDVYAPGDRIISTWPGGRYAELNGTSMATSHVTGVIALILSKYPRLKPHVIKSLIRNTSRKVIRKSLKSTRKETIGLLDAVRSLKPMLENARSPKKTTLHARRRRNTNQAEHVLQSGAKRRKKR